MTGSFQDNQNIIEALLKPYEDAMAVEKRLLRIARLGMDDASAITTEEIKQVCFALVVHYHQLGIN